MNVLYNKGEIVWAKISGYAWWPGKIKLIFLKQKTKDANGITISQYESTPTFCIEFFPDRSYQNIPYDKISKFIEHYEEYSHNKQRQFIKALDAAKNDYIKTNNNIPSKYLYGILGKKRIRQDKSLTKKEEKRQKLTNKSIDSKKNKDSKNYHSIKHESNNNNNNNIKPLATHGKYNNNSNNNNSYLKNSKRDDNLFNDYFKDYKNEKINENENCIIIDDDEEDDDGEIISNCNYNHLIKNQEMSKKLNCLANDLIRYKIEIRGKEANKFILATLENLNHVLNDCNLFINYYNLAKDFIPLLTSFTSSVSQKIVLLSFELINKIKDGFLKEMFELPLNKLEILSKNHKNDVDKFEKMSDEEKNNYFQFQYFNIKETKDNENNNNNNNSNNNNNNNNNTDIKINYSYLNSNSNSNNNINNNIINNNNINNNISPHSINNNSKHKVKNESPVKKEEKTNIKKIRNDSSNKIKQKKISLNNSSSLNSKNEDINLNIKNFENKIIDEITKDSNFFPFLINSLSSEENKNKDNIKNHKEIFYSNYFYTNIYKKDDHLDEKFTSIRRRACIKLYNTIKLCFSKSDESVIKKCALFLEYIARKKDNKFSKKYKEILEFLIKKIKDKHAENNDKTISKNSNNLVSINLNNEQMNEKDSHINQDKD